MRRPLSDISLVHPWDPWEQGLGGFDACLDGLLRYAPPEWAFELIGLTKDPKTRPPGRPLRLRFEGREVVFFPALADPEADRVRALPLSLRFALAARARRFRPRGAIVQYQRFESALAAQARLSRVVHFLHNHPPDEVRSPYSDLRWRRIAWLHERLLFSQLSRADLVVAVDPRTPTWLQERLPKWEGEVLHLRQWADAALFRPGTAEEWQRDRAQLRARLGVGPRGRVVLFAGRLVRQKDPFLMLEALAVLPQTGACLAVVGDGVLRARMEARARSLGLEGRVRFLGSLARTEMVSVYRGADVFVCTSAFESGPRTVFEALACGTAVVSVDVGQVSEVLGWADPEVGVLVRQREPQAVAEAVRNVLAQPTSYAAARRRAQAVSDFTPQAALAPLFDRYRTWLERPTQDGSGEGRA